MLPGGTTLHDGMIGDPGTTLVQCCALSGGPDSKLPFCRRFAAKAGPDNRADSAAPIMMMRILPPCRAPRSTVRGQRVYNFWNQGRVLDSKRSSPETLSRTTA